MGNSNNTGNSNGGGLVPRLARIAVIFVGVIAVGLGVENYSDKQGTKVDTDKSSSSATSSENLSSSEDSSSSAAANGSTDSSSSSSGYSNSNEYIAAPDSDEITFTFRNDRYLNEHYEKHGKEMGFSSAEEYEDAANDVIHNPEALYKTEEEDGDYVYYVEDSNEFVVVSTDGYIRTYYNPRDGIKYFERQ